MTIKKRGLGRGLEALLINVSTSEETLKTESSEKNNALSQTDIKNELQELKKTVTIQNTLESGTLRKIVESNYDISDDENYWREDQIAESQRTSKIINEMSHPNGLELIKTIQKETARLLQEAENLRKLINEFEAMIRQN
jgi:ParB family chromosome partitioning protein